jgi:hypothetical protein
MGHFSVKQGLQDANSRQASATPPTERNVIEMLLYIYINYRKYIPQSKNT